MFVVPNLYVGGAERHVATLLPMLDPDRITASVVCIGDGGELADQLTEQGFEVRVLHRTKAGAAPALAQLVRRMRETRADLVVSRGFNAELLGRVAAQVAGVPHSVVWTHHCSDIRARGVFQRLCDRVLEPVTSAHYGVAHAQVEYLTGVLHRPVDKIRIVHNGIDPDQFPFSPGPVHNPVLAAECGIDAEDLVVGTIAVLRPEKDLHTFLRAASIVAGEVRRARFLIVGDGPERPALTAAATELGIGDRVRFIGSRSDVAALLGLMDVFALSSRTECFPMAVLEAMAVGRPTVCTAVGGVPEMVTDGGTGFLVAPGDPDALAARLVQLLRHPRLAAVMGRAGRDRLESEFTLARSVEDAQRHLEATAGRPAPPPRADGAATRVGDAGDEAG